MDNLTQAFKDHYTAAFRRHGATAKGVDWNDEGEVDFRYGKMIAVLAKDFANLPETPTLLDAGCGWGGLLRYLRSRDVAVEYTGIDIVPEMIESASKAFPGARFVCGDILGLDERAAYDFVVCSGILTLKLTAAIPEMERYARAFIRKMFGLCRHGIAFNMMSTRVNFMADNLYYQSPSEILTWMLSEVTPRVRVDHGYSSLGSGKGRLYEFTIYAFKG